MATYWENSCSFGLRYVSWYKYLIVSLVFSHLGFWSGNLFLIAPFPDLCLLVPYCTIRVAKTKALISFAVTDDQLRLCFRLCELLVFPWGGSFICNPHYVSILIYCSRIVMILQ